jgi:phage shock protein A
MAQSILDKVNTLISANLHGIVDRALESNSVAVMDEYVRQAERNLDELEENIVTLGGSAKTLKRKYDEVSTEVEKIDRDIDTLLTRGKNDLAGAAQKNLNQKQAQAQEFYEQWQQQQSEYQKMMDAKLQMETRLQTIKQEREHLKELLKLTEAKKTANKAIKSLNDLKGVGDDDIRRLGDSIRAKLDEEDARMEYGSQRLADQIEESVGDSAVDNQLEERRKRLGLAGGGSAPAGGSSTTMSGGSSGS